MVTQDNWFDPDKVSDDASQIANTQDLFDCDYPWGSFRDFDLKNTESTFPLILEYRAIKN
jgi:hypothetical protein